MNYSLTDNFIKLHESEGTLHNLSHHVIVEISNTDSKNSGIFINPNEKFVWVNGAPYARAVGGRANLAVVPFRTGGGGGSGGDKADPISQGELDDIIDSIDDF